MNFKELVKSAKEMVLTEEPVTSTTAQSVPVVVKSTPLNQIPQSIVIPNSSLNIPMPQGASIPALSTDSPDDAAKFVESLRNKTDFDKTDIGIKIKAITDNLPDVLQPRQKFETALKIGPMGITIEAVISAIQDMKNVLVYEHDSFNTMAAGFESNEINSRKDKIEQLAADIKDLEAKLAQDRQDQINLSVELADKQNVLARRKAQFEGAFDKRNQELTVQEAYYKSFSSQGSVTQS